jgi:hypothetical protein
LNTRDERSPETRLAEALIPEAYPDPELGARLLIVSEDYWANKA